MFSIECLSSLFTGYISGYIRSFRRLSQLFKWPLIQEFLTEFLPLRYMGNCKNFAGLTALKELCGLRMLLFITLRASETAAQCIVIGPVCLCVRVGVFVCVWVCYHVNSKLRASIFTKLGLYVRVVTISSWLNFGHPAPREGLRRGENFWLRLTTASALCLRLSEHFFHHYY